MRSDCMLEICCVQSLKQSEEAAKKTSEQLTAELHTWKTNYEQIQVQCKEKQVALDNQNNHIQQLQLQVF